MEFGQIYHICVVLLIQVLSIHALIEDPDVGWNTTTSNQTVTFYNIGVHLGIINPEKYSFESFKLDEPIFKDSYEEFVSLGSELMTYQQWLVMNNYGLFVDTQESIFNNKTSSRSKKCSKRRFMRAVDTGDILISSKGRGGLIGHAAIMVTDYWVLDMPGGKRWKQGIRDNNRLTSKGDWYDEISCSESTTVYRVRDSSVAKQAAHWADRNYYNPNGGPEKTIHVTYKITSDFESKNPSYSSKLVLQAYYYGAVDVIRDVTKHGSVINPTSIPAYFMSPYNLKKVGRF